MKKRRSSLDTAVVDVWQRELGQLSTRYFAHRLAASQDLVRCFGIYHKLEKHRGCVNTVSFNAEGDILVSGSDDREIILWDWETGKTKLSFHSGHLRNVFQANIMHYSDNRTIVTCGADGQVRKAQILQSGVETSLLGIHQGRVHALATDVASPNIAYTCGEDGLVQHFDLRTGDSTRLFSCGGLRHSCTFIPIVQLYAIALDPRNQNLFAVAGSDEYARLYDIRKYNWDGSSNFDQPIDHFCPLHLITRDKVGITGLAFSNQSELLVSYGDEFIYLFNRDMGLGPSPALSYPESVGRDSSEIRTSSGLPSLPLPMDAEKKLIPRVYKGHHNCETVKGVNFFGPGCEYVVSGSDCGWIFIWKKRDGELIHVMEADKHVVNCVESHPLTPVLASSGIENDIKIWTPISTDRATPPWNIQKVLSYDDDDNDGCNFHDDSCCFDDVDESDGDDDEDSYGVGKDDCDHYTNADGPDCVSALSS